MKIVEATGDSFFNPDHEREHAAAAHAAFECAADEYEALARQLHESIAEGQSVADTAKALRLLALPAELAGLRALSDASAPDEWFVREQPLFVAVVGGPPNEEGKRTAVMVTRPFENRDIDKANAAFVVAAVNFVRTLLGAEPRA